MKNNIRNIAIVFAIMIILIGCTDKSNNEADNCENNNEIQTILSPGVSINGKNFEDIYYAPLLDGIDKDIVGSWVYEGSVICQRVYFKDGSFINIITSDGGEVYIHGGFYTTENNVVTMTDYEWDIEEHVYDELTYSYEYSFIKEGDDTVLVLTRERDGEVFRLFQNPRAADYIGE